ncbi:MAG TPA: uracil-DNA glycosylase family protein [Candidatus Enterococcus stercoripullorum]|nr:uracil-DNA glycosylase family protein [Candidatus Enterococcus stercoripullorum]
MDIAAIQSAIMQDEANQSYTSQQIQPLFQVSPQAKILIIGQAPGQKAQDRQKLFADASGNRLRAWLGVDEALFYESGQIAILPMDFYFPGAGKSGDLPPRKGFAQKWHPLLLEQMPDIQLTLLIGHYAMERYLGIKKITPLTQVVQDYQRYLPTYFPLIHPSPRNQIWQKKHPWFDQEVLPCLKQQVENILK